MLFFSKIEMEDFGPYKGKKVIDFTDKKGVTIVWGNNGLGKTTLLNAFRYALFNKVIGRGSELTEKKEMINWESWRNGIHRFKVSLSFINNDVPYVLIRSFFLADPKLDPNNENNYKEDVSLWENGNILGKAESQHILNQIMPEQVSRFFLFDGELLQEYQDLLREDKGIGRKIKEAIEEILGVPILSNALADTKNISEEYERLLSDAAQKDTEHKVMGEAISRAQTEIQILQKSHAELESRRKEDEAKLQEYYVMREKNDRIKSLVDEITRQNDIISSRKILIESKKQKICELTENAWIEELRGTVNSLVESLTNKLNILDAKEQRHATTGQLILEMQETIDAGKCVVCQTQVSTDKLKAIQQKINDLSKEFADLTPAEHAEADSLRNKIKVLKNLKTSDITPVILSHENDIADCTVDINDAEQNIHELNKEIDDYSKQKTEIEEIEKNIKKYTESLLTMKVGINNLSNSIEEKRKDIEKAKAKLLKSSSASSEFEKFQNKSQLCSGLRDLMNDSLEIYRKYLKEQVEEDATKIFLNLSNEPQYIRLQINENYGLNIVHENGQIITIRSAGFEHIVALALIGALHKNAPLQGPIVMDSPFGRLDSIHERNIIKYLPNMANQVMLFVFDKEINEQEARKFLAVDLLQEFELTRGSNFETNVRRK